MFLLFAIALLSTLSNADGCSWNHFPGEGLDSVFIPGIGDDCFDFDDAQTMCTQTNGCGGINIQANQCYGTKYQLRASQERKTEPGWGPDRLNSYTMNCDCETPTEDEMEVGVNYNCIGDCMNETQGYGTLGEAWRRCAELDDCAHVLKYSGKFYLRRNSDQRLPGDPDFKAMSFCKKPYPVCHLPAPYSETKGGFGCTGPCIDDNKRHSDLKSAWARCFEVAPCTRVMRSAPGRFYLRKADDPLNGDTSNSHHDFCEKPPLHGNWGEWGACDVACDPGNRSRNCDSPAALHGGDPCAGEASDNCPANPGCDTYYGCRNGFSLEVHKLNGNHGDICRGNNGEYWECPISCSSTVGRGAPHCIWTGTNVECHRETRNLTEGPTPSPTPTPTPPPTEGPTPSPTENVMGHYVVMGRPGASCDEQEDCSTRVELDSESFAIRCCDGESRGRFWRNRPECSTGVTGASEFENLEIDGNCMIGDYSTAVATCYNNGARLCTKEEVESGCVAYTGCDFDFRPVWTDSDEVYVADAQSGPPTTALPTTQRPIVFGAPRKRWIVQRKQGGACDDKDNDCQSRTVPTESNYAISCCADNDMNQLWRQRCVGVWTESDIWYMHHDENESRCTIGTWYDAERICKDNGGRLCTKMELEAGCAESTGCGFDSLMNWSSDQAPRRARAL